MPYLRVFCPVLDALQYAAIVPELTNVVNDLFYHPKSRLTLEEFRERKTVHFIPYKEGGFYIGAKTPAQRGHPYITIELSDWHMSVKKQRKIAAQMTPVVVKLFRVSPADVDNINFRFHSYPPSDFAVGGKLLADIIPYIGRLAKKMFE